MQVGYGLESGGICGGTSNNLKNGRRGRREQNCNSNWACSGFDSGERSDAWRDVRFTPISKGRFQI
jgi:hypothetical protein